MSLPRTFVVGTSMRLNVVHSGESLTISPVDYSGDSAHLLGLSAQSISLDEILIEIFCLVHNLAVLRSFDN